MNNRGCVSCIVPPHILRKLLESPDPSTREIALSTLLSTTGLRAERRLLGEFGFLPNMTGGKRRTVYDCKGRRVLPSASLVRGEGDDPVADATANRAYDGLGETYDFFKNVLNRNSIDGHGMRLDGYVHYGRSFNNAFWNGQQMVFGDGDGRLFGDFTASVDVIAHELTHGVTEFTAGLEYRNQSGALNESVSDVFGSLVKQRALGQTAAQADWLIGAEIFTPNVSADALRSLKSPGNAYNDPTIGRDPQPAHMDQFEQLPETEEGDFGGVHINSGIPNHAFYLVATELGGNAWDAPGHIWYESLKASTPVTAFQEFADRTVETAARLYGASSAEQQAVRGAWREVGIRTWGTSFAPVRQAPAGTREVDGQTALLKKLGALADQVKALTTEVAQLKSARYPESVGH